MINITSAFSSFSASDLESMKKFYGDALGLSVRQTPEGLDIELTGGGRVFIYPGDHQAPDFTVLNFLVENIDTAVDELLAKGVHMERYPDFAPDEKGISRNDGTHPGPRAIAWFKDPAGHILSVIQEK